MVTGRRRVPPTGAAYTIATNWRKRITGIVVFIVKLLGLDFLLGDDRFV